MDEFAYPPSFRFLWRYQQSYRPPTESVDGAFKVRDVLRLYRREGEMFVGRKRNQNAHLLELVPGSYPIVAIRERYDGQGGRWTRTTQASRKARGRGRFDYCLVVCVETEAGRQLKLIEGTKDTDRLLHRRLMAERYFLSHPDALLAHTELCPYKPPTKERVRFLKHFPERDKDAVVRSALGHLLVGTQKANMPKQACQSGFHITINIELFGDTLEVPPSPMVDFYDAWTHLPAHATYYDPFVTVEGQAPSWYAHLQTAKRFEALRGHPAIHAVECFGYKELRRKGLSALVVRVDGEWFHVSPLLEKQLEGRASIAGTRFTVLEIPAGKKVERVTKLV